MPRTAEHLADVHTYVRQRLAIGLPVWDRYLNLAAVFHNDDATFEQRRDAIVRAIRASGWLDGRDEFDELVEVVDHLAHADTPEEFNGWWDELYDIADYDRVSITTR
jgi:hypothetical protein